MSKYYGKKQPEARPKGRFPLAVLAVMAALALIVVGVIVLARPGAARGTGVAAGGAAQPGTGPRVTVDREKLDFGNVKMNTPVTAAFKVRNQGSEPLQILGQPQVRVVEGC